MHDCPECSIAFTARNSRRIFCSADCKTKWNNRQLTRWAPLGVKIQAWRQGRGRKDKKAMQRYIFAEFCLAADRFNAEDRAAGRMSALDTVSWRFKRDGVLGL